ncbi:MAG: peptidase M3 [Bdellovibrio sp. CG12_big_fil_rev_8_21_14_0_65_39_13]|nr:MAG: peptidase M3 [Bdellovibrio sp. CG22_combo_CG10-13_8_21_14_all_39_27]PIQ58703.1 MAG: peptidase M3 [Bdellovibrio sp. CG12_big_fil_rev_8_21_14_0_65_39_13]PIR33078.1 MAG: peptidase M3 [Bdellovibrio sp. CG11_big_fil_rev_8_21_14_0_20_39_38]
MNNPLLQKFETPFETVPFDLIKEEHFLPALQKAIELGKEEITKIKTNPENPNFYNVCEAMENAGHYVDVVAGVFFNLHGSNTNEKLQAIAKEFSPILTEYSNDITLDVELFSKVKAVYDRKDSLNLNQEEKMLLEKQYKNFARNGALLNDSQKDEMRKIDKELSSLKLQFGDNVLKETNDYLMLIEKKEDLSGLPEGVVEAAAHVAKEKGHEGKWAFTLDYTSYVPFVTYADNRKLREEISRAFGSKAFKNNDHDNQNIVKKIVEFRDQRAKLLGYATHAHFVLEERMAGNPDTVNSFINNMLDHAKPFGNKDVEEVKDFAQRNGFTEEFMGWDFSYWSEKLKMEKYSIDDEVLRPYFKLENCVEGIFKVANLLYGINFRERKDIPTYHEDVKAYEVTDESGLHLSVFYTDFYPRAGKRAGAWMSGFRDQHMSEGKDHRPHVIIVCNFPKPTSNKPSLLSFREVTTLFHEFGHALHGMLSKCKYQSLSGTSVYWDFVELPSQIMENWVTEKECLDLFAVHYETGKKIPPELIEKLKKSSNFQEGYGTLRQLTFASLDMAWHTTTPSEIKEVSEFEKMATEKTRLLPRVEGTSMSCSFSHIFQGGYSSGYYSYKWAEVLDADAFELFKQKGIFNKEVAKKFRDNVLSRGGSEHPMTLFKKFRGHEPSPEALLKRAGLV